MWRLDSLRNEGAPISNRRAWIEGVALYLVFAVIYALFLNSLPGKLEHFEEWVSAHTGEFAKSRPRFSDYFNITSNDTNCAVNAPMYIGLVSLSVSLFGSEVFAYRLPGVLLSALIPALSAAVARRFLSGYMALWVGLIMGAQHTVITFARTGGYLAPTLTLYLLVILFSLMIVFENRRWAWIGLTLSLLVAPYFYATVRYMLALPLAILGIKFLASAEFRRNHIRAILCTACVIGAALGHFFWWRGPIEGALAFFEGRGEQLLVTPDTLKADQLAADKSASVGRFQKVVNEVVPKRAEEIGKIYTGGLRVFNYRHFYIYDGLGQSVWKWLKFVLGPLYLLGVVSCLANIRSSPRYMIPIVWVALCTVPLLVTTGVTVNRMVLGLPGDALILGIGVAVFFSLIRACLPTKFDRLPRFLALASALIFVAYAITVYFIDYKNLPHI